MLILYAVTLLKVFFRPKSFPVKSLESFKYRTILSSNRDNLTFLSNLCHFSFCCLNAQAKNLNTTLSKSRDSLSPCLLILKNFRFSSYSIMLTIRTFVVYNLYYVYYPFTPSFF
jgi:hypothetical protein